MSHRPRRVAASATPDMSSEDPALQPPVLEPRWDGDGEGHPHPGMFETDRSVTASRRNASHLRRLGMRGPCRQVQLVFRRQGQTHKVSQTHPGRTSFARRSFSTAAPLTWNSLLPAVLNCDSLSLSLSLLSNPDLKLICFLPLSANYSTYLFRQRLCSRLAAL